MNKEVYKELIAEYMRREAKLEMTIEDVINTLSLYDRSCKISMGMAMSNCKKFLKTNFNIGYK